ncbi:MAG: PAS domain S-box protein, partial [Methanoregula sp.]|nr:PAS domain S-box protein [Methanoregula sp.]
MISVLYVDDEPGLLDIGKLFLEREGAFVVDTFTSAHLALEQLKTERYDAIISDYQMPDMDGITFLKQLKASGNTTPFIIFSGRGREEVVIEALNNGADFYLQKGGETKSQFAELSNKIRYAVTRRRAEASLRESEERYRSVVNDQTEMIARFTPDGVVTFINEAYHSYFSLLLDLQDIKGKNIRDIMQVRNFSEVENFFCSLTRENPTREMERRFTAHDGNECWQIWSVHALFGTDGQRTEYQVVGRDITDRKLAEAALRESEEKYRVIFNNTGAATIIIAPDTTILLANAGWEKLTGVLRADQENKLSWTQFIDKDDVERMKQYHYARRNDPSLAPTVYECRVINVNATVHTCFAHVDMIPGTKNSVASLVDITERRKAEDELRAAYEQLTAAEEELHAQYDELKFSQDRILQDEAKYRAIIENIQECYYRTDTEGSLVLVSPSGAVLLGYSSVADLIGKNIATTLYVNPDEREAFLAEIGKTGAVSNFEVLLKKQDGTPITILTSSHKYYDPDGKFRGIEGIFRDITERNQAEAALRVSEEKFSKTFQSSPDLILLTSIPGGKILEVNESVLRITGYTREEVQGRTIYELDFWVDDADREQYKTRIRAEGKVLNFPARFRQKSGAIITAWISGSIVSLESGPCFISVVNDITDRKRAEDALRESEERYRQFFKTTLDSVFITTPEAKWIDFNDAVVEMFGFASRDEVFSVPVTSVYAHPEERTAFLRLVERDGYVREHPIQFRKRDGTIFDALITIVPQKNPDGSLKAFIGSLRDITGSKVAEEKLRQQTDAMEAAIDGLAILNADQNYTYLNPAHAEIYGYDNARELIGRSWRILYDPDELQRFEQEILPELGQKGHYQGRAVGRKKDGSLFPQEISLTALDNGGLICGVRDITGRKQMEDSLLGKTALLEAQAEASLDGILVINEKNERILINQRLIGMWKIPSAILSDPNDEALLRFVVSQTKNPELFYRKVMDLYNHPEETSRDIVEFSDGRVYDRYSAPVIDHTGHHHGRIWTFRDITDSRRAEEALTESEDKYRTIVSNVR